MRPLAPFPLPLAGEGRVRVNAVARLFARGAHPRPLSRWRGRGEGFGARRVRGYALMAALVALVVVSLASVVAVRRASVDAQRERERQLLWVGNQFRMALQSYFAVNPQGGFQQYPKTLEDLVRVGRGPVEHHHLRQLYTDPLTGKMDWVLEMDGGRIVGLHSPGTGKPLLHSGLGAVGSAFQHAKTYADWHFTAKDTVQVAGVIPVLVAPPDEESNSLASQPPSAMPPDVSSSDQAQILCAAKYSGPWARCRGPNFPMGNSTASCVQEMSNAMDECLAGAGGQ